jgi:hypothetical protein
MIISSALIVAFIRVKTGDFSGDNIFKQNYNNDLFVATQKCLSPLSNKRLNIDSCFICRNDFNKKQVRTKPISDAIFKLATLESSHLKAKFNPRD